MPSLNRRALDDAGHLRHDVGGERGADAPRQLGRDGDGLRMQRDDADLGTDGAGRRVAARCSPVAAGGEDAGRDDADQGERPHGAAARSFGGMPEKEDAADTRIGSNLLRRKASLLSCRGAVNPAGELPRIQMVRPRALRGHRA